MHVFCMTCIVLLGTGPGMNGTLFAFIFVSTLRRLEAAILGGMFMCGLMFR